MYIDVGRNGRIKLPREAGWKWINSLCQEEMGPFPCKKDMNDLQQWNVTTELSTWCYSFKPEFSLKYNMHKHILSKWVNQKQRDKPKATIDQINKEKYK